VKRRVGIWLAICALLVFAMIVVGGITRVTRSGLSITTWDPVTGIVPPIGQEAWAEAFARYQASPEGTRVNAGISLAQFQSIFYVEYTHRLLGRIVGFVLVIPLLCFLARRELSLRRALPMFGLLLALAAQGILGWYMVASGLVDEPHVSPFRLASHLLLGMTLLAWLTWSAHRELVPPRSAAIGRSARAWAIASLALLAATVGYGGLMAGWHAGLLCPTFPAMNGEWVPAQVHLASARALLGDPWTVHFIHRALAFLLGAWLLASARAAFTGTRRSPRLRGLALAALACVALQITLGALLVVAHVPRVLAVLHQANGALLVIVLVVHVSSDISHRRRALTTQESRTGWYPAWWKAPRERGLPTTRSRARSRALRATTRRF